MGEILDVDPGELHLPPSRRDGADPAKLQRQIARHGNTTVGMPRIFVHRASDSSMMIYDGVTRAARVAKLLPGVTVEVEVTGELKKPCSHLPKVKDKLP